MIATVTLLSTGQKVSAELKEKPKKYKRFLFWGGAKGSSDNNSFYFASLNVLKDYGKDGEIIHKGIYTGKSIVDLINEQEDNSIQSIDFFYHGSEYALYMVRDKKTKKGSSLSEDISDEDKEKNDLYASKTTRFVQSWGGGEDGDVINNIKFSKFTNSAKIEIHGCNAAGGTILADNIVINLSQYLYEAGKTESVVIGHSTKANPNLPSTKRKKGETDKEWNRRANISQDYRHGERKVYHNGKVILTTTNEGRITGKEIREALKNTSL